MVLEKSLILRRPQAVSKDGLSSHDTSSPAGFTSGSMNTGLGKLDTGLGS